MQIYLTNLSQYNNGFLLGEWPWVTLHQRWTSVCLE